VAISGWSVAGTSGEEDTMRRISNFISLLLIVAIVVGLVAYSIGNGTQFSLWFFGLTFSHVPVWLPTVVSAVVGFLLAFFVLTPGRLRGAWENNRLLNRISRHEAASEQELSGLRQSTAAASEKELSGLRQRNAELEQEKKLNRNSTETQPSSQSETR
jgi:uncharacterized integral membrane protein